MVWFAESVVNVWNHIANRRDSISPDYGKVEELFCQQTAVKVEAAADQKPKKKVEEVNLTK